MTPERLPERVGVIVAIPRRHGTVGGILPVDNNHKRKGNLLGDSCVQTKLYPSNKVLGHILKVNEGLRQTLFRKSELKTVSSRDLRCLIKHQLLLNVEIDPEQMIFYDAQRSQYRVKREGEAYFGYLISGVGAPRVELTKADNKFYAFNLEELARVLRERNQLEGEYRKITARLRFLGSRSGAQGFFIGLFNTPRKAELELLTLPARYHYSRFWVLCPNFEAPEPLREMLAAKGIYCLSYAAAVNPQWVIECPSVPVDASVPVAESVPVNPVVTCVPAAMPYVAEGSGAAQAVCLRDASGAKVNRDYPRRDTLEFYDTLSGYAVRVNGHEVELDRIGYGLLVYLARALKGGGGVITVDEAVNENIVRDAQHFYRVSAELNKAFRHLIENRKEKLVANSKDGKYRLTIAPGSVKIPHTKWLHSRFVIVREQIRNLIFP